MKTREEWREELKRLAARPNGIDKLSLILTRGFIPFEKLPNRTLMIQAILDHEYPDRKERQKPARHGPGSGPKKGEDRERKGE